MTDKQFSTDKSAIEPPVSQDRPMFDVPPTDQMARTVQKPATEQNTSSSSKPALVTDLRKYIAENGNTEVEIKFLGGHREAFKAAIKVDARISKCLGAETQGLRPSDSLFLIGNRIAIMGLIARHYGLYYVGGETYSKTMPKPQDLRCTRIHYVNYLAEFGFMASKCPSDGFLEESKEQYGDFLHAMRPDSGYPDELDEHIRYIFQEKNFDTFFYPRLATSVFILNSSLQFSGHYVGGKHDGQKFLSLLKDLPKLAQSLVLTSTAWMESVANQEGYTTIPDEERLEKHPELRPLSSRPTRALHLVTTEAVRTSFTRNDAAAFKVKK
jgi:hypothetical protein